MIDSLMDVDELQSLMSFARQRQNIVGQNSPYFLKRRWLARASFLVALSQAIDHFRFGLINFPIALSWSVGDNGGKWPSRRLVQIRAV